MNLREFLKSKKVLTVFKKYYKKEQKNNRNLPKHSEKFKIIQKLSSEQYLKKHGNKKDASSVFLWSDTPQGHNFWYKLRDEWNHYLIMNNLNPK